MKEQDTPLSRSDVARDIEIERIIAEQDVSEVITHAVTQMINGAVGCFAVYQLGHSASYDPRSDIDFGERLLCRAIDEMKARCSNGNIH